MTSLMAARFVQTDVVIMLVSIRTSPDREHPPDAIDLLITCHDRIRTFDAISLRLSEAVNVALTEVADAAASVHRYYQLALPLHQLDEDESLAPRLARRGSAGLVSSLETIGREHREIDRLLVRLLPAWAQLAGDPAALPRLSAELSVNTRELHRLWQRHLELEERTVFPAARELLACDELAQVLAEMRARRTVDTFLPVHQERRS